MKYHKLWFLYRGIVSDVSTKYVLQIWSGAQAVMKLRPDFIAGPPLSLKTTSFINKIVIKDYYRVARLKFGHPGLSLEF